MNTFVIIFRQGPQTLTDGDEQRRAEETAVWARRENEVGHKLDPRILAPEREHRAPEPGLGATGDPWPITALLFLEARDLLDAARVAETHPALRYGSLVEVRPWTAPAADSTPAARQR